MGTGLEHLQETCSGRLGAARAATLFFKLGQHVLMQPLRLKNSVVTLGAPKPIRYIFPGNALKTSSGGFFGQASRLRGFAPSREKKRARRGNRAGECIRRFVSARAQGGKPPFHSFVFGENKFEGDHAAALPWRAFGFLHEGTKARRREGKKFEEVGGVR